MEDHRQQQTTLLANGSCESGQAQERDVAYALEKRLPHTPPLHGEIDCDAWENYWRRQGYSWRTEPEIDSQRQAQLKQYLTSTHESGSFAESTLSRADVEWLLATHEEFDVARSSNLQREGCLLNLRGADLRRARLRGLPLAGLCGGLKIEEWIVATDQQRDAAAVRLERADLQEAHLEGANLCGAHLEEANLHGAHLEGANLRGAHLAGANLCSAHLEGADLRDAHLEGTESVPKPANIRVVFLDSRTNLEGIILGNERYGFVPLADVHWNNVNLALVDWSQIHKLGDEYETQWKLPGEYEAAIRANRQLATVLRAQGIDEQVDYFLYRACVNERVMMPQRAILPVVLRVFVRERMPLPKVLLRLEERRQGVRYPQHPVTSALLRFVPSFLLLLLLAVLQPIAFLLLCVTCPVSLLGILSILRKRAQHPPEYKRLERFLPPPTLLPQQQRRRQQWLLLLGFLLGTPRAQLPLLLEAPEVVLQRVPVLQRLGQRRYLPFLLIFLLLFDDTLVCYSRYLWTSLKGALTGYGYRPMRSISCYLVVLLGFAALYSVIAHLAPWNAFVLSLSSLHGFHILLHGFSGSTTDVVSAIEAGIGLIIEITFVTAFIHRLLRK